MWDKFCFNQYIHSAPVLLFLAQRRRFVWVQMKIAGAAQKRYRLYRLFMAHGIPKRRRIHRDSELGSLASFKTSWAAALFLMSAYVPVGCRSRSNIEMKLVEVKLINTNFLKGYLKAS